MCVYGISYKPTDSMNVPNILEKDFSDRITTLHPQIYLWKISDFQIRGLNQEVKKCQQEACNIIVCNTGSSYVV